MSKSKKPSVALNPLPQEPEDAEDSGMHQPEDVSMIAHDGTGKCVRCGREDFVVELTCDRCQGDEMHNGQPRIVMGYEA